MIYIRASAGYRSLRDLISRCLPLTPFHIFPPEKRKETPQMLSGRYSFWALLTYRLPLISYTRNIANRKGRARTFASHEIAFAYGADCPVPRVKDLARPWWLLASFVPSLPRVSSRRNESSKSTSLSAAQRKEEEKEKVPNVERTTKRTRSNRDAAVRVGPRPGCSFRAASLPERTSAR